MRTTCLSALLCAAGLFGMTGCTQTGAAEPKPTPEAERVRVQVYDQLLTVNGYDEIPAGLFGVHWFDADPETIDDWGIELFRKMHSDPLAGPFLPSKNPELGQIPMVLDCLGDRYRPALAATNPNDFREILTQAARDYAAACKRADWPGWVEFWNEPYLNWAYKPAVNYDGQFYKPENRREGGRMTLKGRSEPTEHLVWTRAVRSVHAEDGSTDLMAYLAYNYIGRKNPEGYEFEFRGGKYRNVELWWGRDPTQVSYFSGQQNLKWYLQMLRAYAPVLKKELPSATLAAGWGYNIYSNNYAAWETLYRPTIDAGAEWIDGITEHHYYTDPRRVAAAYELVTAYGKVKHDKWLRNFNTETQGRTDPQMPGYDTGEAKNDDPLATAVGSFGYGTRDILCQLTFQPDKAATRTSHGPDKADWGLGGDEFVFRLLKPLRGKLVKTRTEDPDIWSVASIDADKRLVVLVYNDDNRPRELSVSLPAHRAVEATSVDVDAKARKLKLVDVPVERMDDQTLADPGRRPVSLSLPARSAVRLLVDLREPGSLGSVSRVQHFSKDVFLRMNPDEIVSQSIDVPNPADPAIQAAWVRIALGGSDHPGSQIRIDDGDWMPIAERPGIHLYRITPDKLGESVKVTIKSGREKADAFYIHATSVVIDRKVDQP
ncbi:MAG: hypothetical protein ACOCZE_02290 [Planctomycetota bacterium]